MRATNECVAKTCDKSTISIDFLLLFWLWPTFFDVFFGEFHVWPDKTKVNFQIEEAKKRIKMRYKNTINTQFNPELIRRMFDRNHCRQITKNRTQWFAVFFCFCILCVALVFFDAEICTQSAAWFFVINLFCFVYEYSKA